MHEHLLELTSPTAPVTTLQHAVSGCGGGKGERKGKQGEKEEREGRYEGRETQKLEEEEKLCLHLCVLLPQQLRKPSPPAHPNPKTQKEEERDCSRSRSRLPTQTSQ